MNEATKIDEKKTEKESGGRRRSSLGETCTLRGADGSQFKPDRRTEKKRMSSNGEKAKQRENNAKEKGI